MLCGDALGGVTTRMLLHATTFRFREWYLRNEFTGDEDNILTIVHRLFTGRFSAVLAHLFRSWLPRRGGREWRFGLGRSLNMGTRSA